MTQKEHKHKDYLLARGNTPASDRNLRGTPDRDRRRPVKAVGGPVGPAPEWLPDRARAEWERVVPLLESGGMICALDRAPLIAYCLEWSHYCEAMDDLDARGLLVPSYRGGMVKNPAAQIARDSLTAILRLSNELGLTPVARARLKPADAEPSTDDGLDKLLS